MNHTKRSSDANSYKYFSIPIFTNNQVKNKRKYVTVQALLLKRRRYGSIDIVSSFTNSKPTTKHYTNRAERPGSKISITASIETYKNNNKYLYVGVKCNMPDIEHKECEFELTFFKHNDNFHQTNIYPNDPCESIENRQKHIGPFTVPLLLPLISSEFFIYDAVMQLFEIQKITSKQEIRQEIRSLIRKAVIMDKEIDMQWQKTNKNTMARLSTIEDENEKWINWQLYQSGELFLPKQQQQQQQGIGKTGIKTHKMMHHQEFNLIGSFQFGAKISDVDNDGYQDLIISGDFGTSNIYWNNHNGSFIKGSFDLIEDILDNSMGATVGDYNLDGKLDVLFTSTSITDDDLKSLNSITTTAGMILNFRGNHLYRNVGNRKFEDVTDQVGIRESGWGWGAFFFDFDNDGDLDTFNGNGMDDPETTDDDFAVNQKARLYVNQGYEEKFKMLDEAFVRGIADRGDNRGAMTLDFDKDGDLDILLVNHGSELKLYENNNGNYFDFLKVYVKESVYGRTSIGAKVWVELYSQDDDDTEVSLHYMQEVGSNAAFLGQSEACAHFGLGKLQQQQFVPTENGHDDDVNSDISNNLHYIYNVTIQWPFVDGKQYVETYLNNIPTRSEIIVAKPNGWKKNLYQVYDGLDKINENNFCLGY